MSQIAIQKQQHLLKTKQGSREPVKKSVKTLPQKKYTAEDLMGLSWVLFEEGN